MQRVIGSPWRFRTAAFFMIAVLLEVWFFRAAASLAQGNKFALIGVLATGGPLVVLTLLLFSEQAFFAVPLLMLIPVQVLYFHAFQWLFLMAFLAYGIRYLSNHGIHTYLRLIEVIFLLYFFWVLFTVSQADNLRVALFGIERPLLFFFAFWAGSRIIGTSRLPALIRVYAWVAIAIALETLGLAVVSHVPLRLIAAKLGAYTDLGWGRSNYVAAVAALTAASALPMAFQKDHPHRRLARAAMLAAIFVAFATASRGGMVAVVLSILLILSLGRLRPWVIAIVLLLGVFVVFLSPGG